MTTSQTPLLQFGPAGPEGVLLADPNQVALDRLGILTDELRALADLAIGVPKTTRQDMITGSVLGTMLVNKRNLTEVAAELDSPRARITEVVTVLEEAGIVESLPGNFEATRPAYRFIGAPADERTE